MSAAGGSAKRSTRQVVLSRAANRQAAAKAYAEFSRWLAELKLASGCVDCGYNDHPAALEFDHREPATKQFEIASAATRKRSTVEAEIAKCDIVCANCHRIRSARHRDMGFIRPGRPRASGVKNQLDLSDV